VYRISKLAEKFDINQAKLHENVLDMIDDNILLKGILEQQADKIIEKFFEEADYQ
jgi:hypothetical protein